jgi:hypothetical protein
MQIKTATINYGAATSSELTIKSMEMRYENTDKENGSGTEINNLATSKNREYLQVYA